MAFRNGSRDEVVNGSSFSDASRSLMRMAGGWGNVSGPGMFMARTVFTGTCSAVTMGIVGASFGAVIWGTAALPFLVSCCGGFIFGVVNFYRDAVRQGLISLERYPTLIQLHLDENFPWKRWNLWRREDLTRERFNGSWVLRSMLVCAWLTSQPAQDEISEARERLIIEEVSNLKLLQSAAESVPVEAFET